jgi:hypothetical protein
MILPSEKLVYIKVPKTASTSIATILWDSVEIEIRSSQRQAALINLNAGGGRSIGANGWHVRLADVLVFLGNQAQDYKYFSVIRDPLERFISAYNYAGLKALKKRQDLISVDDTIEMLMQRQYNKLPRQLGLHLLPQTSWLQDTQGNIPDYLNLFALENLAEAVDFLRTFQSLKSRKLLHKNKVKKPIIEKDNISKDNLKKILDFYEEDSCLYQKLVKP